MKLCLAPLDTVAAEVIVALHADPRVRRHLPLAVDDFDLAACQRWRVDKRVMWESHGYGPWAILVDGRFAGWGGFQPEGGEADLALVLAPEHWGRGPAIIRRMLHWAFEERGLTTVTALLPPSRVRRRGMRRLGFDVAGTLQVGGVAFIRYRLTPGRYAGAQPARSNAVSDPNQSSPAHLSGAT
ncbi:MAG: GNAT family N-acetyltransferase [Rhodocyclaceae bacterium]|nr:GNAT family N-acetyltransferase [Rhodocyclaceae bacterium]